MDLLVAIVLITLLVRKAVRQTIAEGGRPSREPAGGGPRVARYGMWDHLTDSYRDSWRRQTDDLIAKRDRRAAERAANPRVRVSWTERARDRIATRRERKLAAEQATATEPVPAEPTAPLASVVGGTSGPRLRQRTPHPEPPAEPPPNEPPPAPEPELAAEPPGPATTPPNTSEGADMGQPTGEVVNHETHIAELDATIAKLKRGIDLCSGVVAAEKAAQDALSALQEEYGPVAAATATRADHLAALNVDSTTQGHAAEGAGLMPPNQVLAHIELSEQSAARAEALRSNLETALAAAEAEKAEAIRRYADAQDSVNQNLGGNSAYLNNGGGSPPAPAPQPEPVGAAA